VKALEEAPYFPNSMRMSSPPAFLKSWCSRKWAMPGGVSSFSCPSGVNERSSDP